MSDAITVHVHAPRPVEVALTREVCDTCQRSRRFVVAYYDGWYGPTWTCLRCGESWNEDARCERPFRRNWRKESIRSAWKFYVRNRRLGNESTPCCTK